MRAYADALEAIPLALAENSGLRPIETVARVKAEQVRDGNSRLGIDCMGRDTNGITTLHVHCTASDLSHASFFLTMVISAYVISMATMAP